MGCVVAWLQPATRRGCACARSALGLSPFKEEDQRVKGRLCVQLEGDGAWRWRAQACER
jgi:hypothetical protein